MERNYADGALGMGSLGQCNAKPRYAQTTGRSEYLENEKREATALLFQPCRMHRPESLKERQAGSANPQVQTGDNPEVERGMCGAAKGDTVVRRLKGMTFVTLDGVV